MRNDRVGYKRLSTGAAMRLESGAARRYIPAELEPRPSSPPSSPTLTALRCPGHWENLRVDETTVFG